METRGENLEATHSQKEKEQDIFNELLDETKL